MKNIIRFGIITLAVIGLWTYKKRKKASQTAQEKVLLTASEAQIKGLDPIYCSDVYSAREATKVYEGLLEYHYLKRPYELAPNLAAAMPVVSDDQLVYTFELRKGVKFHDNPCFPEGKGRELTAHDFVYSFKRLADPKLQATGFWLMDDKVKGLNEWRQKYTDAATTDYTEAIEGLKAIDRYTLQFTLTKPYPQFLHTLALAHCCVVAQEAVQHYGAEFLNHPVGTGPFTLESFNPQDNKIVYHKNPTFRDKRFPSEATCKYRHMLAYTGKKLPFIDKVITYILPEEQPRWLKLQKGQVDIIDISRDNIALEVIRDNELIPTLKEKEVQLFRVAEVGTSYVVINAAHPLFKGNLKLRQALSMAFDGQRYNELFYNGAATLAQSTIPPGLAGYRADYVNPYRVYDLKKARQYLAEAGYPAGKGLPTITLDVGTNTKQKQQGEFFQKCMEKIGIKVNVVENIFPELVKKINTKATMLHAISWSADYPDAANFLQLLYGPYQPGGIGVNCNDPAFNALYEQAAVMPDSPERTVLYERLNQRAAESVPLIYIAHLPHLTLYQGWIKNYCWSDFHYGTEQYFDVDLEKKQALLPKL
ncbi:MAG: ABC transporter substrate-binding protein [Bacteroidota bacterium]